jgi:hypothetical protein
VKFQNVQRHAEFSAVLVFAELEWLTLHIPECITHMHSPRYSTEACLEIKEASVQSFMQRRNMHRRIQRSIYYSTDLT